MCFHYLLFISPVKGCGHLKIFTERNVVPVFLDKNIFKSSLNYHFLSVKQDVFLHLKRLESPSSQGVSAKFVEIVTDLGYGDISVVDVF